MIHVSYNSPHLDLQTQYIICTPRAAVWLRSFRCADCQDCFLFTPVMTTRSPPVHKAPEHLMGICWLVLLTCSLQTAPSFPICLLSQAAQWQLHTSGEHSTQLGHTHKPTRPDAYICDCRYQARCQYCPHSSREKHNCKHTLFSAVVTAYWLVRVSLTLPNVSAHATTILCI